ncbi:MAG: hypothetical protein GX201_13045 [Clostridiales bacterium]|nr:hypothetical protein [Clostridiales bacterium]
MKHKQVRNVVVHLVKKEGLSIAEEINELYVEIIRRRLEKSNFTPQQKVEIINNIITLLRSKK